MDIDFDCVECGKCCHDLKLPLTISEAMDWLVDGHNVEVICEAIPWAEEPPATDLRAAHKRRRSFAAFSGSLPVRVVVVLAASFKGACPNLLPNMRCGIYARRPLVCRIYPAEISPFIQLQPAEKACPPESWSANRSPLLRQGAIVDSHVLANIHASRETDLRDVRGKELLCASLQLNEAAVANEGFVLHTPEAAELLRALRQFAGAEGQPEGSGGWQFASNKRGTVNELEAIGALCAFANGHARPGFEYLGFHTEAP